MNVRMQGAHAAHYVSQMQRDYDWSVKVLTQPVPDRMQRLHTGTVWKLGGAGNNDWLMRQAILTKDAFYIVDKDVVREVVQLADIIKVKSTPGIQGPKIPLQSKLRTNKFRQVDEEYALASASSGDLSEDSAPTLRGRVAGSASASFAAKMGKRNAQTLMEKMAKTTFGKDSVFMFLTDQKSLSAGRSYVLQVENAQLQTEWVRIMRKEVAAAQNAKLRRAAITTAFVVKARSVFQMPVTQGLFALLIAANFVVNLMEAQIMPWVEFKEDERQFWEKFLFGVDIFFTSAFWVELIWNFISHIGIRFFFDPWNDFDLAVVLLATVALFGTGIKAMNVLRLFRVVRAVRLFRKITSLRIIFNSIIGSIVPVLNSVFILLVFNCMFSILAVKLYRGVPEANMMFDNFQQAMFSMWQVGTGDSWASGISRPLFTRVQEDGTEKEDFSAMIFFTSYSLLHTMVLLNVVVAVLMEKFARVEMEEHQKVVAHKNRYVDILHAQNCMDPLLERMSHFDDVRRLNIMISALFEAINVDNMERIGFDELQYGLRMMNITPPICIVADDYDHLTSNKKLQSPDGRIDAKQFNMMLKNAIELYVMRRMNHAVESIRNTQDDEERGVMLMTLKYILALSSRPEPALRSQEDPLHRPVKNESPTVALAREMHNAHHHTKYGVELQDGPHEAPGAQRDKGAAQGALKRAALLQMRSTKTIKLLGASTKTLRVKGSGANLLSGIGGSRRPPSVSPFQRLPSSRSGASPIRTPSSRSRDACVPFPDPRPVQAGVGSQGLPTEPAPVSAGPATVVPPSIVM